MTVTMAMAMAMAMTTGLRLGTAALVVLGIGIAGFVIHRSIARRRVRARTSDLDERLATALGPGTGSHLERAPTVRRLATADHDRSEAATLVPIVRIDLGTTDAPGMTLVFEYVADAVEAIHPVCTERSDPVDHYEVEFTFGPGGLIVSGECRRVSVSPALADRLCDDDRYGAFELRNDVERADRRDGEMMWEPCRS